MKRILAALVAVAALLTGAVVSTAPASAYIDDPYINGRKFASTSICVGSTLLQSYYRVGYVAQSINNGTNTLALTYSTDCAGAGFPPSRRMVVGTFQNSAEGCLYFTNQYHDDYNGFWRWTSGPGIYLNTAHSDCIGTQIRRDHWISQGIAWHLGLNSIDDPTQAWRVMSIADSSESTVPLPVQQEMIKLDQIYMGNFCDSGTVC